MNEWMDGWMDVNSGYSKLSSPAADLVLRDLLIYTSLGSMVGGGEESSLRGYPHEGQLWPSEKRLDGVCQWPGLCAAPTWADIMLQSSFALPFTPKRWLPHISPCW